MVMLQLLQVVLEPRAVSCMMVLLEQQLPELAGQLSSMFGGALLRCPG
jgi:hypothetical protein